MEKRRQSQRRQKNEQPLHQTGRLGTLHQHQDFIQNEHHDRDVQQIRDLDRQQIADDHSRQLRETHSHVAPHPFQVMNTDII